MLKKILVVEDDPGYQDLIETILCPIYDVTLVASAEVAFDKLDKERFDLIITDINLLGMTGFEVLARIKNAGLEQVIPVIMCSGHSEPLTRERAMKSGAAGFVTKPYPAGNIISLVRVLLGEKA